MNEQQTGTSGDNRQDDSFTGWLFRHRHKLSVMIALAFGYGVGCVAGELKTRREYGRYF